MIKKERSGEWVKSSQQVSPVEKQGEKEALFLVEKQKIMAALAATTSQEEFEKRLRAMQTTQPSNIQDEEASSSSNYLQSNEDNCYRILDWLT